MKNLTLAVILLFTISAGFGQSVIYVNQYATGADDGSSWSDGYTNIEDALTNASSGDSIWVRMGRHRPKGGQVNSQFKLVNGVGLYGGFDGSESKFSERDIEANVTYLDGNIGDSTKDNDNVRYIVYAYQITTTATLDGFTIQNGYAYVLGSSSVSVGGGGLRVRGSKVNVRNCVFQDNYTYMRGAALYTEQSSHVTIENCVFRDNYAGTNINSLGGAIYANDGSLTCNDVSFISNSARRGGAISGYDANIYINRCKFFGNEARVNYGGAIDAGPDCYTSFYNSLFVGNYAEESGSVFYKTGVNFNSHYFTNCTFTRNKAKSSTSYTIHTGDESDVENCIFWDNFSANEIFYLLPTFDPKVANCVFEDSIKTGTKIYISDPLFIRPDTVSKAPFDASGYDYGLKLGSPCINTGDTNLIPSLFSEFDVNLNKRVRSQIDIGAVESPYESFTIQLTVSDTNAATVTNVIGLKDSSIRISYTNPSDCYRFMYWTESDTIYSYDSSFAIKVKGERSFSAVFSQDFYLVSYSTDSTNGGAISGKDTAWCDPNQIHTLTATPNGCFRFVKWTSNGIQVSSDSILEAVISSDTSFVAHFAWASYQLTTAAKPEAGGSVTGDGTFDCDSTYRVVATPASCHNFKNWTIDGKVVGTDSSYTGKINKNQEIVANFTVKRYTLTLSRTPTFGGTISGAGIYNCNEKVTVKATSNTDYKFDSWQENGTVVFTSQSASFNIDRDIELKAVFTKVTGIEDEPLNTIRIYPSPTDGLIWIDFGGNIPDGNLELKVYDQNGRLVKILTPASEYDISDLKNGVYEVQVTGRDQVWRSRVVKW